LETKEKKTLYFAYVYESEDYGEDDCDCDYGPEEYLMLKGVFTNKEDAKEFLLRPYTKWFNPPWYSAIIEYEEGSELYETDIKISLDKANFTMIENGKVYLIDNGQKKVLKE
jgi:hypothetical protein